MADRLTQAVDERRDGQREGLLTLLRRETGPLHADVEAATDLPRSIRSRDDYVDLLWRYRALHAAFEEMLAAERFTPFWASHDISLAAHRRTPALAADLSALEAFAHPAPDAAPLAVGPLANPGQAIGCLYVLEGSSLGGRVLARSIVRSLPGVPTGFLSGRGRNHPQPWRSLCIATMAMTDDIAVDAVAGAALTFAAFGTHLAVRTRSAVPR